ncbi:hypothetical protein GQ43DRAFT_266951 [Delitschia confertaspora ATCC 74209]|uniref:Uncharacterized protein n=1 Tax=Delitschia confertaspora ATCC 74209 TaxID=1513339 RepID=A0A9P4JB39_9PLEO|nr:hypothetical protein GQ43DRAFT_266951 [Delitschia confertaspora ATCC 74209]
MSTYPKHQEHPPQTPKHLPKVPRAPQNIPSTKAPSDGDNAQSPAPPASTEPGLTNQCGETSALWAVPRSLLECAAVSGLSWHSLLSVNTCRR